MKDNQNDIGEWVEDIRRIFFIQFKGGINHTYVQMIRLYRSEHQQVYSFIVKQLF